MIDHLVTVREGKLRGQIKTDICGENFYSFQGIPYAKPPIGELRFKSPQPHETWDGIRDALEEGSECYAKHSKSFSGSEDCLFLNVFTKYISSKILRPVMFWIHGGGFTTGSSKAFLYGPEYLMTHDVVLVTINYRLGVLGFLTLEDTSLGVQGNAGLKDVVMALNWVQSNIEQFSGDSNNVTVFGESAGGAIVHYLMLSPLTKGLFHKAYAQSGSALNDWTVGSKSTTYLLAAELGIESNSEEYILQKLEQLTVEELCQAACKLRDPFYIGNIRPFAPVIEKSSSEPAFLTEDPNVLIKSGRYHNVPLIMGYCSREGMFCYNIFMSLKNKHLLADETIIPHSMKLRKGSRQYSAVVSDIKQFYLNGKHHVESRDDIYRLYRDNTFLLGIYNAARYHLETSNTPIYFYKFSLDTNLNFMKSLSSITDPGTCHADDLAYLFKNVFTPDEIDINSPEAIAIQRVTTLWTNFAKFGNPTPYTNDKLLEVTWNPIFPEKFNYLDIGGRLEMKIDPAKEEMYYWNELYKANSVPNSKL